MVSIAILGAGYMGKVHANVIKNIDKARVVVVLDKSEKKRKN